MERSEHKRDFLCSEPSKSNSNFENDGNANTTPDQLNAAQNQMTITDSRCNTVGDLESDHTVGKNSTKTAQVGKRKPRPVASSLTTSVELPPAKPFENGDQPAATIPLTPYKSYYICPTCNPEIKILTKNKKAHLIHCHPDVYFLSSKLDSVCQEDFKEYCNYLVKQLVLSSKRLFDDHDNPLLGCSLCCFTSKREVHVHYHLCTDHENMVKKKLVRLQQDATSITKLRYKANQLENSCFSDNYCFRCLNCHKKFRLQSTLQRHMKKVCEKTSGAGTSRTKEDISHPRVPSNHPIACEHCDPPRQYKKSNLLKHKIQCHIEVLLMPSKPEGLSEKEYKKNCEEVMDKALLTCEKISDNGKTAEFVCSFCSNISRGRLALQYHLYGKHKEALFEKLSK